MNTGYTPVSLAETHRYAALAKLCGTRASDYSIANLLGWAAHYGLEWHFDEHLCWIRQTAGESPVYWAPIGPWEAVSDWGACAALAGGNTFIRVPERLALLWQKQLGDGVNLEEAREQWDYLYLAQELMELSGKQFHNKKNLFRQFEKLYTYTYSALTADSVHTVLRMQNEWCRWRDCEGSESLFAENKAVALVLEQWENIPGLCGGVIHIEDVPVAYTLAEPCGPDTLVIHFEKAASDIKGGYQAINCLFARDQGAKYRYFNREQDMGGEGLRQAKLSYNPVDFVKKYTVRTLERKGV